MKKEMPLLQVGLIIAGVVILIALVGYLTVFRKHGQDFKTMAPGSGGAAASTKQ